MEQRPSTIRYAQEPVEVESRPRAAAAIIITCLLAILVPGMVALIGYRSMIVHGPSTAVLVTGDASLDGAKIQVTESIEPHRKWHTTLDRNDGWQGPILLDPGPYHILVKFKEKTLLDEDFAPDQINGVRFDLPSMVMIIGNSAMADSRIEVIPVGEISHMAHVVAVKLSADSHYREPIYLLPGEYRVMVRAMNSPDRIIAQADFKVDRLEPPVRVDLTKSLVDQ